MLFVVSWVLSEKNNSSEWFHGLQMFSYDWKHYWLEAVACPLMYLMLLLCFAELDSKTDRNMDDKHIPRKRSPKAGMMKLGSSKYIQRPWPYMYNSWSNCSTVWGSHKSRTYDQSIWPHHSSMLNMPFQWWLMLFLCHVCPVANFDSKLLLIRFTQSHTFCR